MSAAGTVSGGVKVAGSVTVVTGGGSGIGAALARRFAADGAAAVVVADRDEVSARLVADEIGGRAAGCDVADEAAVAGLVRHVLDEHGRIDLWCGNAGITTGVGLEDPGDRWHAALEINVMAHVYAARAVLPAMLARGSGHFLVTASAAGLLTSPGDAPYSVSKHAAVALAEWLAVTYGDRGIGVSVLCPLGVATPLLLRPLDAGEPAAQAVAASGAIVSPDHVAEVVVRGLAAGEFLLLPHPEVGAFWAQKASDPARWLAGVRRLVARSAAPSGPGPAPDGPAPPDPSGPSL